MRNDKAKAIKLRQEGHSYNQINKKLSIPKSTLSYWLKDVPLPIEAKNKINSRTYIKGAKKLIDRNKQQTKIAAKKADRIKQQAKKEVSCLIENKLFLAGISLYWAEGYKKGAEGSKWKCVDFANSDPKMIKLMIQFFTKICNRDIKQIKALIILHKNVNSDFAINYWANTTKIPTARINVRTP